MKKIEKISHTLSKLCEFIESIYLSDYGWLVERLINVFLFSILLTVIGPR